MELRDVLALQRRNERFWRLVGQFLYDPFICATAVRKLLKIFRGVSPTASAPAILEVITVSRLASAVASAVLSGHPR